MQQISLADLAKVKGVGNKTIERVREFLLAQEEYVSEYNPALHIKPNSLNLGDCLELMNGIPNNSVDMVLVDLPYDETVCDWDNSLPLSHLWQQYQRIAKQNAVFVFTATQPFATDLINSKFEWFRYEWSWIKNRKSGQMNAKIRPMIGHENVLVFYEKFNIYNRQLKQREIPISEATPASRAQAYLFTSQEESQKTQSEYRRRTDTIAPDSALLGIDMIRGLHPTQKPVELFEYLIRTYTNEGGVILDNTAGVYTTAIAAINTNRRYICIEKEEEYHLKGSRWVDLVLGGVDYKEAMKQVKQEFSQE